MFVNKNSGRMWRTALVDNHRHRQLTNEDVKQQLIEGTHLSVCDYTSLAPCEWYTGRDAIEKKMYFDDHTRGDVSYYGKDRVYTCSDVSDCPRSKGPTPKSTMRVCEPLKGESGVCTEIDSILLSR